MPKVVVERVTKVSGGKVAALNNASVKIRDGEFSFYLAPPVPVKLLYLNVLLVLRDLRRGVFLLVEKVVLMLKVGSFLAHY